MKDKMEPIRNIVRSLVDRDLVKRSDAQDAYEIIRRHFAIFEQDHVISNRVLKIAKFDILADADKCASRELSDKILETKMMRIEETPERVGFPEPSTGDDAFIPSFAVRRRYTVLMLKPTPDPQTSDDKEKV